MVLRITTIFSGVQGAPYYNNMYFSELADAQDMHDAVADFWGNMQELISDNCSWTVEGDAATINITTGQPDGFLTLVGSNNAGTNDNQQMSPALQGLCQWVTAEVAGGRRVRGRTFVPALCINTQAEGLPTGATIAAMGIAIDTLIADAGGQFEIYSRTHQLATPVTAGTPWGQFAVLRSRRD